MSDTLTMLEALLAGRADHLLDRLFYLVLTVAAAVLALFALAAFIFVPGARLMAGLILTAAVAYAGKRAGMEDKWVAAIAFAVLAATLLSVYTGALTLVELP